MDEASRCHVIFCAFYMKSTIHCNAHTHTFSSSLCSGITVLCTQTSYFVFRPFPRWCLYVFVHLSLLDAIFVAAIFFVSLILFGSSLDFTCTRQRPQYSNNENINSSSSAWRANILNFHWRMYEARCAVRQRYKSAESMCRLYEKGLVLIKTWAHEVYVQ